jgi:CubicO group peptidase (beta-lactamase class C family)
VIHKDRIIAEKYDTGFDKDSKILGWSMTKSITATILEYLKNRENMIYPNQLNSGVAAR